MRARPAISKEQWVRVAAAMAAVTSRGPKGRDDRSFFEAIVWILRTGAPWRDLPEAFGKWSRSYRRFRRWALAGRWEMLRQSLRRAKSKLVLIDSTIIEAHPHAAGALRRAGGQSAQALGRSRGGLTTKLHAAVSERGELVRYIVTAGQVNDVTQAGFLTECGEGEAVIGDRAYDSDALICRIEQRGKEGRGGLAVVYRAQDAVTSRTVALKRLQPWSDVKERRRSLELFEREFHTLAQLVHPRIIEVYDYAVDAKGSVRSSANQA